MKKHTIIALLLALLMTASMLLSCAADPVETAPVAADTTETAETVPEEETELLPDIPALDFAGETFTFLTSDENDTNGVDWKTYDVWVEATNGDAINDAVFERNLYLEETYNIVMAESQGVTETLAKQDVTAGTGDYDAVMTNITAAANLAQGGYTLSMYDLPYIDLTKPWWDQGCSEDLELLGNIYFATGDITVIDNDATWVLMFNKQLHEDNGFASLYDLVREDKWTYDVFYDMVCAASRDLNGDGKMVHTDDIFGFATSADSAQGLFYASGEKLVYKDSEGYPYLSDSVERMADVVLMAGQIMADKDNTILTSVIGTSDGLRLHFEEGRGLFFGEVMQCIIRMRESETSFGLVPWPKFDESQEDYHHFVHGTAGKVVTVTAAVQDQEMSGAIVEAMAAKSMYTLTPAYYDVALTRKYMRDEESAEMLDIILQDRRYDLGYIYNWGSMYSNIVSIISAGRDTFASTWERGQKSFNTTMEKTLQKYEELDEQRG
ncbi:MAG: hypothetical protein IJ480_06010 [Clostridia bacterium]|nr:hypothetical protein [Clostridia bacterium]